MMRRAVCRVIFLCSFMAIGLACHRDAPARVCIAPTADTARQSQQSWPYPVGLGRYGVEVVHYGSGSDIRRAHYGKDVDIATAAVDLSTSLSLSAARRVYWGVSATEIPVNGRVHLPVARAPGERFPLILMAHGSHNMLIDSELGYDYLGRHLASHGFIFVSMDMNFLNPFNFGYPAGAMSARARLFLAHLAQWQAFDATPGRLAGVVDRTRVVFAGHSRGGEAALAAAVLHEWTIDFHDRFGHGDKPTATVRSVVALAPTDGRYPWPVTEPKTRAINYLAVHGSHDGDVLAFEGLRAFQRTELSARHLAKAAVFVHRGNHGQWNTRWGTDDRGIASRRLLRLSEYLPARAQRDVARGLITAFLDGTVRDRPGSLRVFTERRWRQAWFPGIGLVTRFQTGDFFELASFAGDKQRATGATAGSTTEVVGEGVRVRVHNADEWTEGMLPFRARGRGHQHNRAAAMGWRGQARVDFEIAPGVLKPVGAASFLHMAMVPATVVDLAGWRIEVEDQAGQTAAVPLGAWTTLTPPLAVRLFRDPDTENELFAARAEVVLESVIVPVRAFVEANALLSPESIRRISLIVRHAGRQRLYLDSVGFLL